MSEITVVKDRKNMIGGSDIAAILGLSRFKTPLRLWAEKVGEVEPEDLSTMESVELGIELEDFVAKKFQRKTGLKVRRAPKIYSHEKYDFLRCQVDRLIEGTDELLEVKTTSAWMEKHWAGEEIPQDYICQVIWQLGMTGRAVGHIAVLIGGQKFRTRRLIADKELFSMMVEQALNFWKCVQERIPPMASGLDNPFIVELYPQHGDQIQQVDELNDKIALLMQTKGSIAELEKTQDEIEAQLKSIIGNNLGIRTKEYFVTWKEQIRKGVDVERLKESGLYEQYLKQTSTRILRVQKEKKS